MRSAKKKSAMSSIRRHAAAAGAALALFAAFHPAPPAVAQSAEGESTAAALFAYYPKEGERALFEEGYRRHLDWHRQKNDALVWYAWDVMSGERAGLFIDGTFGMPFAALGQRVDPAGDVADFAQTTAPFADTAFRSFYRLRPSLSTGRPLEERQPSPQVEVVHYVLRAGMEGRLEAVLEKLRQALATTEGAPVHTWYQLVTGGEYPSYMLMIPRYGWSDYDTKWEPIAAVIERGHGAEAAAEILEELARSVRQVRRETWRYRKDLSYFPEP